MNKSEIIELIENKIMHEGPYDYLFEIDNVKIIEIEMKGGEGQGEHHHVVFEVESPNFPKFFVKADGYYSSYGGTEYSDADVYEAESYMKEVKDWREVK